MLERLYKCLANEIIDTYEFPEVDDQEYTRIVNVIIQLRSRLILPDELDDSDLSTIVEILERI